VNRVHVVLPAAAADPRRPSGGNAYDRRVCRELAARGWDVHQHRVGGGWPEPDAHTRAGLARILDALPDKAIVLVDGLYGTVLPERLLDAAGRLRLVLLVHSARLDGPFATLLAAAGAVVTTSEWMRRLLAAATPTPVAAAVPGVDRAAAAPAPDTGSRLLAVGALTPHKGQDVLVDALADLADLPWTATLAGPLDRDPSYVAALRERIATAGLGGRTALPGPLAGAGLERAYARADLLVHPTRADTYGMVVAEALARGRPVLAAEVGGVPEAVGATADGRRPGLLVPPDDPAALAGALRRWLTDPGLRRALRAAAADRIEGLPSWSETAAAVERVLLEVAA
jgi:glycosyltransferase involved in cell wall biosynthesis